MPLDVLEKVSKEWQDVLLLARTQGPRRPRSDQSCFVLQPRAPSREGSQARTGRGRTKRLSWLERHLLTTWSLQRTLSLRPLPAERSRSSSSWVHGQLEHAGYGCTTGSEGSKRFGSGGFLPPPSYLNSIPIFIRTQGISRINTRHSEIEEASQHLGN